ncbi:hypothetical protein B0J15DRAFT_140488 [Fusarium solani]|uniref:Uncharacterized protein n=1 Tax=Fusarium solani TaxID=169388 RepID=A0A9P9GJL3_FUSSL|nr:uncharacterized protein B0J15DRAFT_140488 [Fusarium solani]KAH7240655.1 hypothetical protein B0J15DRAFT_140488 [Fusarium solani]
MQPLGLIFCSAVPLKLIFASHINIRMNIMGVEVFFSAFSIAMLLRSAGFRGLLSVPSPTTSTLLGIPVAVLGPFVSLFLFRRSRCENNMSVICCCQSDLHHHRPHRKHHTLCAGAQGRSIMLSPLRTHHSFPGHELVASQNSHESACQPHPARLANAASC